MKTLISLSFILISMILSDDSLIGSWIYENDVVSYTLTFKSDNTYEVDMNSDGQVEVTGSFKLDNGKITMKDSGGPMHCEGDTGGSYEVSVNGNKVSFKMIEDTCQGRMGIDGATLIRK